MLVFEDSDRWYKGIPVLEQYKMIAEFMGHDTSFGFIEDYEDLLDCGDPKNIRVEDLAYNSDWNRLMPVVEKIENIKTNPDNFPIRVVIDYNHCSIDSPGDGFWWEPLFPCKSKIEATYKAVVEFIEWYNDQEK